MESGIRALTVALALPLPGDYLPLEGSGVTDQQESVAGLPGHSLLTAIYIGTEHTYYIVFILISGSRVTLVDSVRLLFDELFITFVLFT